MGIHDALAAFDGPMVEVHISNPNAREPWRHISVIAPVATGSIMGFGMQGYDLAVKPSPPPSNADRPMDLTTLPPIGTPAGADAVRPASPSAIALLVTDMNNVRWLTGFTGSQRLGRADARRAASLVTDGRYGDQAAAEMDGGRRRRRHPGRRSRSRSSHDLLVVGLRRLRRASALDADHAQYQQWQALARRAPARAAPSA